MHREYIGMDRKTKQWLANTSSRNYWRVCSYYDIDDLIQDGMLIYHRVTQKYKGSGKSPAHILNTYKASFKNHIHDLANKRTRQPVELQLLSMSPDDNDYSERFVPGVPEMQTLAAKIAKAPVRVREVLQLFASDDECKRMRAPYRVRIDGQRETLNDRLCRLAGFDPDIVDLVSSLKIYFSD
jgi:hypothetical protein